MSTYVDSGSRDRTDGRHVPAYGPVEAALGLVLFFVVFDRATPTVVAVLTDALPDVSPSLVGLGLAALLWFVLAVTVLDQARRQFAALGVGTHEEVDRDARRRGTPSESQALGYLVVAVLGAVVAAWTFGRGVGTAVEMVRIVSTVDVGAFVLGDFLVMVVFFASFGLATRAVDRLIVGGLRTILAD